MTRCYVNCSKDKQHSENINQEEKKYGNEL